MNRTDSDKIAKKLEQMNELLASISAREVLFIIALTFLILFALLNLCLAICERRRKKQNSSVPQSIVIQPNSTKSSKRSDRSSRHEMTSGYDQDVLPSKSMKMKLTISPSMSKGKKRRSSKDSTSEESHVPTKSENSQKSENSTKKHDETSVEPSTAAHSASTHPPGPLPPASHLIHSAPPPASAPSAPPAPPPAPGAPAPPPSAVAPKVSESSDSLASFTVPEESGSKTKTTTSASKDSLVPTTPTATTLSGSISGPPEPMGAIGDVVSTAKDITQPKSAPATSPTQLVIPTTPPPVPLEKKASEKKI